MLFIRVTPIGRQSRRPYTDATTGEVVDSLHHLREAVQNPEALDREGIRSAVVDYDKEPLMVEQVSGYTQDKGIFHEIIR